MRIGEEAIHPCIASHITPEITTWASTRWASELGPALEFFRRFYHAPLSRHVDITAMDAAECASGGGLNAIAFVLAGGRSVVGYDKTVARVEFARELADRLGLADRVRFEVRNIHELPPQEVDVFFSLQTLEHVPRPLEALRAMADRARSAVVLSTPNLWWPKDGHDTGLLFAHWAPKAVRRRYARLRRARTDQLCRFLSPREIERALFDFSRVSNFYNFETADAWLSSFPVYFPYGQGGGRVLPARRERLRWRSAAAITRLAPVVGQNLAPMIEGIFLRRG